MTGLRRKLLSDLWRLRFQCVTIALLVGCGIASFAAAVSASASVQASREAFYADARFADVFVRLKRATLSILARLRDVPGVAAVDGRVVTDVRVLMDASTDSVGARLVSLRWPAEDALNQVQITAGRLVLEVLARVNTALGTTIAVVTHNAPIAQMADRVVTLADGCIASDTANTCRKAPTEVVW